jgi:hypothetical protein
MRGSCKSAAEALAETSVAGLLDQARLLGRLSALIEQIDRETGDGESSLPPPRCALQGRTLLITVSTSSHAAKLRQSAGRIEELLRLRASDLTGIRIRLQPGRENYPKDGSNPGRSAVTEPRDRPEHIAAALRFADDLASTLHDSALRRAALRLRSLLRKRLGTGA